MESIAGRAKKREVAAEVLKELHAFGYTELASVYVRDFNLDDPEIQAYIVKRNGDPHLLGCHFNVGVKPYCTWHRFGQASPEELKRQIMARPYRLYPAPVSPSRSLH